MNHLAHTFISYPDTYCLVGNYLTDFLTVNEIRNLDERYFSGVELHRQIDSFTDSHADVKKCIEIIRPFQQKYTPVVVDVYFDYLLIKHWTSFSDILFDSYISQVYKILQHHLDGVPQRMQVRVQKMIQSDFLRSCDSYERLAHTFAFIKSRTKFENNLHYAHQNLFINEAELEHLFLQFFPELLHLKKG